MSSREIVLRTIRLEGPPRIAYHFGKWGPDDFGTIHLSSFNNLVNKSLPKHLLIHPAPLIKQGSNPDIDEFGCLWKKPQGHTIGYVSHHPLKNWSDLRTYDWPDPDNPRRFVNLGREAQEIRDKGLAVMCGYSQMLFERLWTLHGFEKTLIDIYTNPAPVEEVLDRLTEFSIRLVRNAQDAAGGFIDVWATTDDWGTQKNSVISPEYFEGLFKPCYRRIFEACHEENMYTYMHSDGKINALLPHLIEAGLDIIEIEQAKTLFGIDDLLPLRKKITFDCMVDNTTTMLSGDVEAIQAEARELVEKLASLEGGFIADIYWDPASCGIDESFQAVAVQAFKDASKEIFGKC